MAGPAGVISSSRRDFCAFKLDDLSSWQMMIVVWMLGVIRIVEFVVLAEIHFGDNPPPSAMAVR